MTRIYPGGTDPAGQEANQTLLFMGVITGICLISLGICLYQVGSTGNPAAAIGAIGTLAASILTGATWLFLWHEARRG